MTYNNKNILKGTVNEIILKLRVQSLYDQVSFPFSLKPFSMKKFMMNGNLNVNPPSTDRINPQKPVHGAHGALKNGAAESHAKYGGGGLQEIKHHQGTNNTMKIWKHDKTTKIKIDIKF